MGNESKVFTGARAKLGIVDTTNDTTKTVGLFTSVSYSLRYDASPVYILGKFAPAEIDYTAQEMVSISCSGWRVIGSGPHAEAGLPKLEELLTHEYLTMQISDRQTGAVMATFSQVRPVSFSTTVSARQLQEMTVEFVGILVGDETSGKNDESAGAVKLVQNPNIRYK